MAKLAGDAADARLTTVAASMLLDQDEDVAHAAERSLVVLSLGLMCQDLAQSTAAGYLAPEPDASLGRALVLGIEGPHDELLSEVARAAANFGEHRRRAAVLAALSTSDRFRLRGRTSGGEALRSWLAVPDPAAHHATRSVLRWSRMPILRLRALELLAHPHLCTVASDRLLKAHSVLEHELVFANAHLLLHPARAAAAATLKLQRRPATKGKPSLRSVTEAAVPNSGAVRALSPGARLGLIRFTASLAATAPQRNAVLAPLLADTVPFVRHAAMRASPNAARLDFCFDREPRVAASAMLSWSAAASGVARASGPWPIQHARALSLLARSPHEAVRAWAAQDLGLAPDPAATTIAGRLTARRLLAQDRRLFLDALRADLAKDDLAPSALAQVRALDLAADLEPELLALARPGRPPRLVATAIAALGEARREAAVAAAAPLLEHGNDRVRANAVETIGHAGPAADLHSIIELKADANHRVRANATRAEFLAAVTGRAPSPDLHEELTRMLTDTRPMHRLAGLWLAGRTLPLKLRTGEVKPELAARIAEAARFDEDPRVRVRAAACSQRIGAELRLIWRNSRTETSAA